MPFDEALLTMDIDEEVTLRKMRVFLSFMRLGSLSAVADELSLSTVSVHRALHSLEEGLRCPLFRKSGRALLPLPTAHAFAEYAQRSLAACEEGIRRTRQVAGFEDTRMTIGSGYSLTVRTIPQLIFGLKARRPQLDVNLKLGSTRELLQMLREEAIDAAVAVMSDQEAIDDDVLTVELYRDPVMFAAPLDSPYAALDTMDLRLAREQPFVALNQDFITMQAMQPLFDKAGFQPRIALRAGNLFSLANLVAEGVGCGLLPSRVALFNTRLRLIPLTAEFAHWQSIRLVVPRMHERKPNVLALIAECRSLPEANG